MNTATRTIQVVRFPGSTRVVLGDEALAMVADALEFAADDSRTTADALNGEGDKTGAGLALTEARRLALLAEAIRASRDIAVNMDDAPEGIARGIANDLHDEWGNA